MNYAERKKIIIISIIAIIININIDHGIAQNNNIIRNLYEWTKLYLSKIILKININNIKKISHRKWNKLIKIINGNQVYKKPIKTKRYFKIVTWNKGNSNFNSENESNESSKNSANTETRKGQILKRILLTNIQSTLSRKNI